MSTETWGSCSLAGLHVDPFYQQIILGLLLIAAVIWDQREREKLAKDQTARSGDQ